MSEGEDHVLSHVVTEPHPSYRRLLAPSQPTPRSPSHSHLPLSTLSEEIRARKAAPTPADHAVDHPVPTPIKSLRYSPASLPPPLNSLPRHDTTRPARRKAFLPFRCFCCSPRGQASWPASATQLNPNRPGWPHDT